MLRSSPVAGLLRLAVVAAAFAVPATPAAAQRYAPPPLAEPHFGIGYVANLPDVQVGGAAYVLLPTWGGIGLYVDAKFATGGPTKETAYDPNVTAEQVENEVGGIFIKDEKSWWSVNAALLRPLSPYFTLYAGGGVAHSTTYRLYDGIDRVEFPNIGFGGVVWAEDPRDAAYQANFMVGMITRLSSRLSAHFGYETQPSGVTAGVSLRIPRW